MYAVALIYHSIMKYKFAILDIEHEKLNKRTRQHIVAT